MGYTTDFTGEFEITPPLTTEQIAYLRGFSGSRRMRRKESLASQFPDPAREAVGLPIGPEGGYYVGGAGQYFGQSRTPDIVDYNKPPSGQPGLWCQWVPTDDGRHLQWDGGEKFYDYCEWATYICEHFLLRWGRKLTGRVRYQGEDSDDRGVLVARGEAVSTHPDRIVEYQGD